MMSDSKYVVTLSNLRQNTLEFELDADGISVNEADVNLVIEAANMGLAFNAKRTEGKKWEVDVPPLPMLKKTSYPFKVTLASEGYYFEPMNGSVNIVGAGSVNVTSIPTGRTKDVSTMTEAEKKATAFGGDGIKLSPKENVNEGKGSQKTKMFENVSTVTRQPKGKKQTSLMDSINKKPSSIREIVNEAKSQTDNTQDTSKKDELVSMILNEMKSTPNKSRPHIKKGKIITH